MILVLNCGSSSVKYKLFNKDTLEVLHKGNEEEIIDYGLAFNHIFKELKDKEFIDTLEDIKIFGHRVVHGGEYFNKPVIIDEYVKQKIEELIKLAPLHNGANLQGIKAIEKQLPNAVQVAVFDTAYHQTIPKNAYLYPIPLSFYEEHNIRKYGFHGTSHNYVAKEAANFLAKDIENINLITLHLGNGSSATAIQNGNSINTSMGFTPLEGLMMGTRSGSIDPSIILYMHDTLGIDMNEINRILNKKSGLRGVCGNSDLRAIQDMVNNGNEKAKLALDIFVTRIKEFIGSYAIELGHIDAIVFTGGIGENSSMVRELVFDSHLEEFLNTKLDKHLNKTVKTNCDKISVIDAKIPILVIKTDEEKEIAIRTKTTIESL